MSIKKTDLIKAEQNVIERIRNKVRKKSQKCYSPDCTNLAIRSHVQQASGPLLEIASKRGCVVQLEDVNFTFTGSRYLFREKGIRSFSDVMTFWGFCAKCDDTLFKSIEKNDVDYNLYKNQLLYSYRGFLNELYKMEYNVKQYDVMISSDQISSSTIKRVLTLRRDFLIKIKSMYSIKRMFEMDLKSKSYNFDFLHFILPRIEICTAAIFSYPVKIYIPDVDKALKENTLPIYTAPNFINLIPQGNNLNVILGTTRDMTIPGRLPLMAIAKYTNSQKLKLISDIVIKHLETWFISVNLYEKWKESGHDANVLRRIHYYLPVIRKEEDVDFSMFEY